jgi:hypothetical protein
VAAGAATRQLRTIAVALLAALVAGPIVALAAPEIIWARVIDNAPGTPGNGNPAPTTLDLTTPTPIMALKARLSAPDIDEIELLDYKVTPAACVYPECEAVDDDDVARVARALLKIAPPGPANSVPADQNAATQKLQQLASDPVADWIAKYGMFLLAAAALIPATVGVWYQRMAHRASHAPVKSAALVVEPPSSVSAKPRSRSKSRRSSA